MPRLKKIYHQNKRWMQTPTIFFSILKNRLQRQRCLSQWDKDSNPWTICCFFSDGRYLELPKMLGKVKKKLPNGGETWWWIPLSKRPNKWPTQLKSKNHDIPLYSGFAIITCNNPRKIGETLHHQGTNATCQSLGARFFHLTVGPYGGPQDWLVYLLGILIIPYHNSYMDVSKNSGTPKSSILRRFSIFTIHFGGIYPYFRLNTHI